MGWSILLLVVLRGLSYWLLSMWQHPGEPLSVQALYRAGDMEYFPLIQAFAQGNFGEIALLDAPLDAQSSHLASFPFASIALHGLIYRFLGVWGLPLADLLVTIAYFGVLVKLLGVFQLQGLIRQGLALLVVSGTFNQLVSMVSDPLFGLVIVPYQQSLVWLLGALLGGAGILLWKNADRSRWAGVLLALGLPIAFSVLPLHLWGLRLPRPFVSEVFFLLCVGFSARLFLSERQRLGNWIGLGLAMAALLQGDFHSTVVVAIAIAGLGLSRLVGLEQIAKTTVLQAVNWIGVGSFGLSFGVGILPFLVQRWRENPQAPVRLGLFSISHRLSPLWLPGWMPYGMLLGLLVLGFALVRWGLGRQTGVFWSIWAMAATFALPISTLVLGKTVQPFQFVDRFERVIALALLVLLGSGFTLAKKVTKSLQAAGRSRRLVLPILLALALACNLREMSGLVQVKTHMRSDFAEWGRLSNYRSAFNGLTQELSKPSYKGVMGSFDLQPYVWWVGFRQGKSFLPPAPLTTVDDREIEMRLAQFCQILNMPVAQYLEVINNRLVQIFWLGHNKHQASGAYTFAPLSDYSPASQKIIAQTGQLNSQNVLLPKSEQLRLIQAYLQLATTTTPIPPLDVIVLTRDGLTDGLVPGGARPENSFVKTYENEIFQVWRRR